MFKLNLELLEKALSSLKRGLARSLKVPEDEEVRDGVIQRFEYTYELCWKALQKWIFTNRSPEEANPRTKKDIFRMAARYGLIEDPERWFTYTNARNLTVHVYDEIKAEEVYSVIKNFVEDATYLFLQLKETND